MAGKKVVVGQAVVPVVAELGQLKKDLDVAKKQIGDMTNLGKAAGGILKGAIGGVAVAAVVKFAKESLAAYAQTERSILRLQATSLRYGSNIEGLSNQIGDYLNAVERTTRFQDTEAADSINNLITHTKDLKTAMELNSLAMDYAEQQGIDLAQASDVLAQAFDGTDRGLMALAKSMGITGAKANDAKFLFDELEKRAKGSATGTEDLQGEWTKLGAVFDNVVKEFWSGVSPMLKALTKGAREAAQAFFGQEDTSAAAKRQKEVNDNLAKQAELKAKIADLDSKATLRRSESEEAQRAQMGTLEAERQEYRQLTDQLGELDAQYKRLNQTTAAGKSLGDQAALKQINTEIEEMNKGIGAATDELIKNSDETEKRRAQIQSALGGEMETVFTLTNAYNDLRDAGTNATDAQIARAQKLTEIFNELGNTIASAQTEEMKKFFDTIDQGADKAAEGLSALGKGFVKGLATAISQGLQMWAAYYTAKAAAHYYSFDFVSGTASLAAAGALTAGAALVESSAAKMADGGVTMTGSRTEDTIPAVIRKNEGVIPLDDPRAVSKIVKALGGGGGINMGGMTFYGVEGAEDAIGRLRTAGTAILRQIDEAQRRKGVRVPRGA